MSSWIPFYATVATASATLMGLLFVAVSVSASAIATSRAAAARALAEQALANLLATLLVSLVAIIPSLSFPTFGGVVLWLSCPPALLTGWRLVAVARTGGRGRFNALRRHGASLLAFAMLIIAAGLLRTDHADHLSLLAVALLLLISSATMSAWELLLAISRYGAASEA